LTTPIAICYNLFMQTFLPCRDFKYCAKILDYRRLGKQRVESKQILNILLNRTKSSGWRNHPAVKMWKSYENALKHYYNIIVQEWIDRGYNNTMLFEKVEFPIIYPKWFEDEKFFASHRSNLLRKNKEYYSQFGWKEENNLEYIWPINEE
jgi:hypothetical protein